MATGGTGTASTPNGNSTNVLGWAMARFNTKSVLVMADAERIHEMHKNSTVLQNKRCIGARKIATNQLKSHPVGAVILRIYPLRAGEIDEGPNCEIHASEMSHCKDCAV